MTDVRNGHMGAIYGDTATSALCIPCALYPIETTEILPRFQALSSHFFLEGDNYLLSVGQFQQSTISRAYGPHSGLKERLNNPGPGHHTQYRLANRTRHPYPCTHRVRLLARCLRARTCLPGWRKFQMRLDRITGD